MYASVRCWIFLAVVAAATVSLTARSLAGEADDQYAVAAAHYDQGRWQLAVEEFRAFLRDYPQDQRHNKAVFFLGEALLQSGDYAAARARFEDYLTAEPAGDFSRAAQFRIGEAAYLAGDFDAAKTKLSDFRGRHPDDPLNAFVLPYLGEIALIADDVVAAEGLFREALKRFPDGRLQDDCRVGLARALEKRQQTDEAERLYRTVAEKPDSPQAAAAQFHLGAMFFAAGNHRRAVDCFATFDARFADSPWQPNARLGRGLALLKLDRPAEAIEQFDAVLAAEPAGNDLLQRALRGKVQAAGQTRDHETVDRLAHQFEERYSGSPLLGSVRLLEARSYIERKDFARAVAQIESALADEDAAKPDLEGRYLLAVAYRGLDRNAEALAALLPVVDSAAGRLRGDAQLLQGSLLMALGKYAEAVRPFDEFLAEQSIDDGDAEALAGVAICLGRAKRLAEAKQRYAELIEKHPDNPLVLLTTEQLAEAAFAADDPTWAEELSKRLASTSHEEIYAIRGKMGQGWSQYKAGRLAEAADTFGSLLKDEFKDEKSPSGEVSAEAAFVRGKALEELGRNEAALEMYEMVADRHPSSPQHHDALLAAARLYEKLNQPHRTADCYERLASDHPDSSELDSILYAWAWAALETGEKDRAEELFLRVCDERPKSQFHPDAAYRAARMAFERDDLQRAESLVAEFALPGADPRVREFALGLLGKIAASQADWPKVRDTFETLLKDYPETGQRPVAEYWIAESQYAQNDYPAAAATLERLAERIADGPREPWMGAVPLRRAQILALQERWTDAYGIAVRIEKEFPGFPQQYEVDYLLGRCLANRADFEAARSMYKKVISSPAGAKTETAALAQWMIGESFFHQKKYEEAIREYLRLETLYAFPTWQAASLFQAGKCYELLGEPARATELYRRILAAYPQTSFADRAKGRLNSLSKVEGEGGGTAS